MFLFLLLLSVAAIGEHEISKSVDDDTFISFVFLVVNFFVCPRPAFRIKKKKHKNILNFSSQTIFKERLKVKCKTLKYF